MLQVLGHNVTGVMWFLQSLLRLSGSFNRFVTFSSSGSEAEDIQNTRDKALSRPVFKALRKIHQEVQVSFSQVNPLLNN